MYLLKTKTSLRNLLPLFKIQQQSFKFFSNVAAVCFKKILKSMKEVTQMKKEFSSQINVFL